MAALFYSKSPGWQTRLKVPADLAVGLGFGALAMAFVRNPLPASASGAAVRLSRLLAEFSYSLYVTHFPIVLLIAVAFYHSHKIQPDAVGLLQWFAWLCALVALGFGFWWIFEKRTDALRRWFRRKTNLRSAAEPNTG